MSLSRINALLKRLRDDQSGNALMLVALGMPVLISGSGLAVDTAQWYVWKRELQYAVDQAALAGAWASADPDAADMYSDLAKLEYGANLSVLKGKAGNPVIGKADWDDGDDNSVVVTASYSAALPFTSIFWKQSATINVRAQASFQAATNYTTCLLALDPDDPSAVELGGSTTGKVTCGLGSLSNSATAVVKNGNPSVNISDIIAAGGIDSGLTANGLVHQYISNLSDPYEDLTPPDSPGSQLYDCVNKEVTTTSATGNYTAKTATVTTNTYTYWQGKNENQATTQITYTGTGAKTNSTTNSTGTAILSAQVEENSSKTTTTAADFTGNSWNSTSVANTKIYEKLAKTETVTYTNVQPEVVTTTVVKKYASPQPGTYSSINIGCDTDFAPGVYVITGSFDLGQNHSVTGANVMFVMTGTNSANFSINSQSKVNFSGITKEMLMEDYDVSEDQADKMKGMILFDRNSTSAISINGGASVVFEGTLYMPQRPATFNGNSSMDGKCMMLAARTLKFTGTNDFSSFCIPPTAESFDIGGTTISVRLVA